MTGNRSRTSSDGSANVEPNRLERRRQHQHGAGNNTAQLGTDVQEGQPVAQNADDPYPDENTPYTSLATVEWYAAQQHGGKDPDLESGAKRTGWRANKTGDIEKRGDA